MSAPARCPVPSRLAAPAAAVALALAVATPGVRAQDLPSRQVTIVGILAVPGSETIDRGLQPIAPLLRRLKPNHGFTLLDDQSRRLLPTQAVGCTLSRTNGQAAEAQLLQPLDPNGNVVMKLSLYAGGSLQAATVVQVPPNQFFFYEQKLPDGNTLMVGLGAR